MSTPSRPTVPVCDRCRQRRQKCDQSLSGCNQCRTSGVECIFTDPEKGETLPRVYVQRLEEHLARLRELQTDNDAPSLQGLTPQTQAGSPSGTGRLERLGRRFLGDSSGTTFIRQCISIARDTGILPTVSTTSDDNDNATRPQLISLGDMLKLPAEKVHPDRPQAEMLFRIFDQLQFQYIIITSTEFDSCLDVVFDTQTLNGDHAFIVVKMVMAIALFFLGRNERNSAAVKTAETYFDESIEILPKVLLDKSSCTLQALLLILQFSLANPRHSIVWQFLGYSIRLATALGLHQGDGQDSGSTQCNFDRRVFWALYSIDRAVGNTLGRPPALQDKDISVPFPSMLSDTDDTSRLLLMNHCCSVRQLQSEAADTLYQRIRPYTESFISTMQSRADQWLADVPAGYDNPAVTDWIRHVYHNFCMFIHRPSLQNPEPSSADLAKCFSSASAVLRLYWKMYRAKSIDATWMAIHWLFLAAVTHLFCLWVDEDIRDGADWSVVYEDMQTTSMVLSALSERFRSAESSPQLYHDLSIGTIRKYAELYPVSEGAFSPDNSSI